MKTNTIQTNSIMKKSIKAICIVLLLMFGVQNTYGVNVTWDFSEDDLSSTSKGQITMSYAQNDGTNQVAVSSGLLRLYRQTTSPYNGCSVTFTAASGYQITGISVTFDGGRTSARGKIDNGSYADVFSEGTEKTVTISSLTASSYSIQNQSSGSSTVTISSISITYSTSGCVAISPSLTYSSDSLGIGGTATVSSLTGNTGGGTVTYSSSNTSVATVNSSTGEVSAVATGSATITATIDENGGYCDGSATADIIVRRGLNYYIGNSSYTIGGKDDDLLVSLLPHSPSSCEEDNYPYFYGWRSGTITGSTTTPPTILDDETLSSSSAANTYYAVFRDWFCWNGGTASTLTAYDEVSASGLGSDYAANNMPYMVKLDHTGDYIIISTKSQPSSITIKVKMIGGATSSSITVQQSTAADEEFTDVETLSIEGSQNDVVTLVTSESFASTTRAIKLVFTKGSNVGLGYIRIDGVSSALYVTSCAAVYDITLDKNGGEANGSAEVVANRTSLRNISVPTQAGYHIEGYYTDAAFTTKVATAAGELQPSITVGGNAWTDEDGEWVRGAGETFYTKWLTYSDYKFSCAELTLEAHPETANAPIFITSVANKKVRSQGYITISGNGLTPSTTLTFPGLNSKFEVLTSTGGAISTDGSGNINVNAYIFYTPGADETTDGILKITGITAAVSGAKPKSATLTQDIIGRHLPTAGYVIAGKKDNKWYALPSNMATTINPKPSEIAVDDFNNPSVAYTNDTCIYGLEGPTTSGGGNNIANGYGQYVRLTMSIDDGTLDPHAAPLFGSGTGTRTIGKSGSSQATSDLSAGWWWLLKQTNTSITNPQDAKYTISCANNTSTLTLRDNAGKPDWGLFASGVEELRLIPASNTSPTEAEVVEWGQHGIVVEVDANGILATSVVAYLGENSSSAINLSTTNTSKGTSTKYNYTVNFGDGINFAAEESNGALLRLEWKNGETVKAMSNIIVPKIIATSATMSSIESGDTPWSKWEVHVLPGVKLTANAGDFSSYDVTIKHLEIYPGAIVEVTKGAAESGVLTTTTLVLRNGWTTSMSDNKKTYGVSKLYVTPSTATLKATNVYADWYIDFDQYYPIAVPWNVTVSGITYKNTSSAITVGSSGRVRLQYYDGANRANGGNVGKNWKKYGDTGCRPVPTALFPSHGYAMTAQRPTGKAFAIVRMPLSLPSGTWGEGSWTTGGEKGTIGDAPDDVHKDTVVVTAHGIDATPAKPWHKVGWNYIANPYMTAYDGKDASITGKLIGENGGSVKYATILDPNTGDYDQIVLNGESEAGLNPQTGFFVQVGKSGSDTTYTLTFSSSNTIAPSSPARYTNNNEAIPEQEAYIRLSNDEGSDQMGLIIGSDYTEEYEVNADLSKILGDGNTLKTYMRYGSIEMAYVAINEQLAREFIPVTVHLPATGEYTYSLRNSSTVDELEGLYLIDYLTGETTNLLFDDYTFIAEEGTISDRFALNAIVGERKVPTGADVTGLDKNSKEPIKFIWHDNVYILHNNVIYDSTGKRVNVINK